MPTLRVHRPSMLLLFIMATLTTLCGCSTSSDSQSGGDTLVQEDWFRLTLPGAWARADARDQSVFVFDSDVAREQLTVSLFFSAQPMDPSQREETCQALVDVRREAERNVSGASLQLSDVSYGDQGDVVAVRFTGSEPPDRQSATLLLCAPETAGIFYYEAFDLAQAEFETRAAAIMNSIELGLRQ